MALSADTCQETDPHYIQSCSSCIFRSMWTFVFSLIVVILVSCRIFPIVCNFLFEIITPLSASPRLFRRLYGLAGKVAVSVIGIMKEQKPKVESLVEENNLQNEKYSSFSFISRNSLLSFISRHWWIAMGFLLTFVTIGLAVGLSLALKHDNFVRAEDGKDTIVDLGYSKYNGKAFPDGTSHWLRMRYAAPPIGNLRFAAPQDPEHTGTVQAANAVRYTPVCEDR